jgi:molybdopterin-guanine dinucleotide biosynthesis protein A
MLTSADNQQSQLSLVIQAGGESRRMGQDKALLPFLGQPLIAHMIARLANLADEILVTTNHPEQYTFLDLPLFTDLVPGRGALGGLYTALSVASYPLVAVVACDMPFINSALLAAERDVLVATQSDIVIPDTGKGLEPFHAIYRRETCLPRIHAALHEGAWRVDAWFNRVKMRPFTRQEIETYDPQLLSFWNVNTPEELQAAAKRAASL